jgi:hypothetical protein
VTGHGAYVSPCCSKQPIPNGRSLRVTPRSSVRCDPGIAEANGLSLADIIKAADEKKVKLGGFDTGKILLQTAIGAPGQTELSPNPNAAQVLSRSVSSDTKELPFTFFGFAELEQPRSLRFEDFGISLELTLKSDRLVVRVVRDPEQLELPFSLEVDAGQAPDD